MSEKDTTTSSAPTPAPSPMELVLQFHHTYSVPIRPFSDPTLDYERMNMRMSLIAEEFAELMGAVYGPRARAIIEAASITSRSPSSAATASTVAASMIARARGP